MQADNAKGTSIFMRLHWSLSLSTNALISALIVVRLLLAMHKMRRVSGHSKGRNAPYLGIIAIVTESSLLYTLVVGIAYPIYGPTAWLFQYTRATENMVNPLLVQTEVRQTCALPCYMLTVSSCSVLQQRSSCSVSFAVGHGTAPLSLPFRPPNQTWRIARPPVLCSLLTRVTPKTQTRRC